MHVFTWNTDPIPDQPKVLLLLLLPLVRLERSGFPLLGSGSDYFGTILASFSAAHLSVTAPAVSGDMEWSQTSRARHGALHSSHSGNATRYLCCGNKFGVKEVAKATLTKFIAQPINHIMTRVSAVLFHSSI